MKQQTMVSAALMREMRDTLVAKGTPNLPGCYFIDLISGMCRPGGAPRTLQLIRYDATDLLTLFDETPGDITINNVARLPQPQYQLVSPDGRGLTAHVCVGCGIANKPTTKKRSDLEYRCNDCENARRAI